MKPRLSRRAHTLLDSFGIGLSGLCLVHCLALPMIIALFPLVGEQFLSHKAFHQIILIGVIPAALISLGIGYKNHHHKRILWLGFSGVAALVFAAFALHLYHAHHLETAVTVGGGLLLAWAHIDNFRCRHHHHESHCCHADHNHEHTSLDDTAA